MGSADTTTGTLPSLTRWIVVGGGFAGAATGWALAARGLGPGLILEQEFACGTHASGRNAGLARFFETDPIVGALARRSVPRIRRFEVDGMPLMQRTGGLTLVGPDAPGSGAVECEDMVRHGIEATRLSFAQAVARFPFLASTRFDAAIWCPAEGVVDIHGLLGFYLASARAGGFGVHTNTRVESLLVEAGRVTGVETASGTVRADAVIDATGAWAGRLGGTPRLEPRRRHLFVSTSALGVPADAPLTWIEDAGLYFRPETGGLLLSPCDETVSAPGLPSVDPRAAELLAEKIGLHAPGFGDLEVRRSWACLRTFAPDRRPVIGPDPRVPGLFHVSGLGGIGMMCSAAIGELAATVIAGGRPDWIDPPAVAPARLAG